MYTPKKQQLSSITFKGHMALDHNRIRPRKQILGKQIRPNFLRSTSLLHKILTTNLGLCKPTFSISYKSHLRSNSTIDHTDLGQNALFHNFSRQIALSQYSGRSIVGIQRNRSKNFQSHLYGQPVLTFEKFSVRAQSSV